MVPLISFLESDKKDLIEKISENYIIKKAIKPNLLITRRTVPVISSEYNENNTNNDLNIEALKEFTCNSAAVKFFKMKMTHFYKHFFIEKTKNWMIQPNA